MTIRRNTSLSTRIITKKVQPQLYFSSKSGGTTGYNSNPLELHSSRNTDNSRKKVSYKALFLENLITVGLQRSYIILSEWERLKSIKIAIYAIPAPILNTCAMESKFLRWQIYNGRHYQRYCGYVNTAKVKFLPIQDCKTTIKTNKIKESVS